MLWKGRRESDQVIDVERQRPRRVGGVGLGTVLFLGVAIYLMGGDPRVVLQVLEDSMQQQVTYDEQGNELVDTPEHIETKQLTGVILASLEDTWAKILRGEGLAYKKPNLVLFRDGVDTACGYGQSVTGPFYCPADERVYLDLSFLDDLKKMGGAGDFALAYVIAHEIGHHVQNILGIESEFRERRSKSNQLDGNVLQVRMELQADCFAGIWAHYANQEQNFIEKGDIEEGIKAASAVGDDHLQEMAGRRVSPESFTHGSSKDRVANFLRGFDKGSINNCRF